ncbi:hypothetical protein I302_100447 [Kwoniella bestiolae CBS 10118]|uniref:Uncharacterized protein n=1 Tax=Kwoniella bestiolae CBS 10118 TaxID=1296100 RepID=A0A1B9G532_9TREE|nr:hypothetical protein I302_03822 [Kwoniella bestiolae CBS 10118]OCF26144.1 hypothetical protein I302_03822 [Kwoniella bestiolae CBS 10118]
MDQPALLLCMCTCSKLAILGKTILPRNLVIKPDLRLDGRNPKKVRRRKRHPEDELESDPEPEVKIQLIEQVKFLTIHLHKDSLCKSTNKEYPNVTQLLLIFRPSSIPYHQSRLQACFGKSKDCFHLRNVQPKRLIIDDFTIGLSGFDCAGVPLSLYGKVEELILRCGPIPVNNLSMAKL